MRYVSTRGGAAAVGFMEAVVQGVAPDGGLYMPQLLDPGMYDGTSPRVDRLLVPFLAPDFGEAEVRTLVRSAVDFSIPLTPLDDEIHLLELTHGPSAAFKDVGARFLARVLGRAAGGESGAPRAPGATTRTVLVATSGDTGGAVAGAFEGVPGTRVVVLFPRDGVTPLQRRQFTTLGGNIVAVSVPGPFDRCQDLVRDALSDPTLAARHRLTSANSINLGRLLPQMTYYVHAARLLDAPTPTFVVPSGNLGNLTAGLMAAQVAIPGARFVGAVNRNATLVRWLEGGAIRDDEATVSTPSTAMDVARPSNLERLGWLARGRPVASPPGEPDDLRERLEADTVDDATTRDTLREVYQGHGRFICPHTAVGVAVARRLRRRGREGPIVVLETAHAAKFAEVVEGVTGVEPPLPPRLARLASKAERIVELPAGPHPLSALLDEL